MQVTCVVHVSFTLMESPWPSSCLCLDCVMDEGVDKLNSLHWEINALVCSPLRRSGIPTLLHLLLPCHPLLLPPPPPHKLAHAH